METKTKVLTVIIDNEDLSDLNVISVDDIYKNIAMQIGLTMLEKNGALFYIHDNLIEVDDNNKYIEGKLIKVAFEYVLTDPKKVLRHDIMGLIKG